MFSWNIKNSKERFNKTCFVRITTNHLEYRGSTIPHSMAIHRINVFESCYSEHKIVSYIVYLVQSRERGDIEDRAKKSDNNNNKQQRKIVCLKKEIRCEWIEFISWTLHLCFCLLFFFFFYSDSSLKLHVQCHSTEIVLLFQS